MFRSLLYLICLFHFSVSASQTCDISSRQDTLNSIATEFAESANIAGVTVSLGLLHDQQIEVFSSAAGLANIELNVAMMPEHVMPIASISKLLTASALGRMKEAGLIQFDAKVAEFLPELSTHLLDITIAELSSHTSGIRHYVRSDRFMGPEVWFDEAHIIQYPDINSALQIFIHDQLVNSPGESVYYSSYAWTLLSAIMESTAKKPFLELMNEWVLTPFNLTQTSHNDIFNVVAMRAATYEAVNDAILNAPPHNPSYIWAGGGYMSTSPDLVKFALLQLDGELLSPDTLIEMLTPQALNNGSNALNGIGWEVSKDELYKGYVQSNEASDYRQEFKVLLDTLPDIAFHAGSTIGAHSMLILIPEYKVSAAFISNTNGDVDAPAVKITFELLKLLSDTINDVSNCRQNNEHKQ